MIDRLVHRPSGTAVVSGPQNRELFQIVLDHSDKQKTMSAGVAKRSSASLAKIDGERVVVMQ